MISDEEQQRTAESRSPWEALVFRKDTPEPDDSDKPTIIDTLDSQETEEYERFLRLNVWAKRLPPADTWPIFRHAYRVGSLRGFENSRAEERAKYADYWSVQDKLTSAVYYLPNKTIAEAVAKMHGNCEVHGPGEEGASKGART